MAHGPGRFDDLATKLREEADAETVVVIVFPFEGKPGFSVQTIHPGIVSALPSLLRQMADEIERDVEP